MDAVHETASPLSLVSSKTVSKHLPPPRKRMSAADGLSEAAWKSHPLPIHDNKARYNGANPYVRSRQGVISTRTRSPLHSHQPSTNTMGTRWRIQVRQVVDRRRSRNQSVSGLRPSLQERHAHIRAGTTSTRAQGTAKLRHPEFPVRRKQLREQGRAHSSPSVTPLQCYTRDRCWVTTRSHHCGPHHRSGNLDQLDNPSRQSVSRLEPA